METKTNLLPLSPKRLKDVLDIQDSQVINLRRLATQLGLFDRHFILSITNPDARDSFTRHLARMDMMRAMVDSAYPNKNRPKDVILTLHLADMVSTELHQLVSELWKEKE